MRNIKLPELPSGYAYINRGDDREVEVITEPCIGMPVLYVVEDYPPPSSWTLHMGSPETDTWTYTERFDNAQDAVDAGIARLWLGAWE